MWRLTDEAVRYGVASTTRYRSKLPSKRRCRSHHPAPQRQASGAKGGHAARKTAARLRRSDRLKLAHSMPRSSDPVHLASCNPAAIRHDEVGDSRSAVSMQLGLPSSPYYPVAPPATDPDFGPVPGPSGAVPKTDEPSQAPRLPEVRLHTQNAMVAPPFDRFSTYGRMQQYTAATPDLCPTNNQELALLLSPADAMFYSSESESGEEPLTPPTPKHAGPLMSSAAAGLGLEFSAQHGMNSATALNMHHGLPYELSESFVPNVPY